jgi:hypothetical protein
MQSENSHNSRIPLEYHPKDALDFVLSRQVINLFKAYLSILERENSRHIECLNKLSDNLPDEYRKYIDLADWFTDEEMARLRKEVLEYGNNTIRQIKEETAKYEIELK